MVAQLLQPMSVFWNWLHGDLRTGTSPLLAPWYFDSLFTILARGGRGGGGGGAALNFFKNTCGYVFGAP